jgi:hypothetical protein
MSTPRQIKASDTQTGMRVRVSHTYNDVTTTREGEVTRFVSSANVVIGFADGSSMTYPLDHPVTVLADPEPKWVEGAWYWGRPGQASARALRRVHDGFTPLVDGGSHFTTENVTVLGRVLVVDWPGDDVARDLESNGGQHNGIGLGPIKKVCRAVADAIRTQGGVR